MWVREKQDGLLGTKLDMQDLKTIKLLSFRSIRDEIFKVVLDPFQPATIHPLRPVIGLGEGNKKHPLMMRECDGTHICLLGEGTLWTLSLRSLP